MRKVRQQQITSAAALLCALTSGAVMAQAPAPAAKPPATAGFLPPASSTANVIDAIAVVVNDDIITKNELAARVRTIEQRMRQSGQPLPDMADVQRQVMERMIAERAQIQMAKEYGVKVDDSMVDRTIARIAESQKISVQEMRNQMEKEGVTYASFREDLRNEMIVQRLREHEVDNKIQVSDAEVDTYLAAEKAAAADAVEINVSQILVRIPDNASTEQINARKLRADEVMRQLRTGADFSKMAATYSDSADALKGGEVGWRAPERIAPLFAEALSKLKPGQVTQPIKTPQGFYILKLVDRRKAVADQAQNVIQQTHARHILIKTSPTVTAADARHKLNDIKERLANKSAKFEELARLFSNDSSAGKGGDLGWLNPGDTVPEFETAMNGLQPGQVSDIVETAFGLHLIEVIERKADDQTREKERNAARQVLRDRKLEEAIEEWTRQVRDRAYVEYRIEDR